MLTTLTKALSEGRFYDKLKVFTIPQLLSRWDRVSADRPSGGDAVFPAHQPALRARAENSDQQPELRQLGRRLRRPGDRQRDPRPDPASRDDDQHPGRFVSAEGQSEVGGGQTTDHSGSVSDGKPVDAAGAVYAETHPPRLGQAADGLPTATTGTHLIVLSTRGGGGIVDDRRWGKFECPLTLIHAHDRASRIVRLRIGVQDLFHVRQELGIGLRRDHPILNFPPGHPTIISVRRMVSWLTDSTISSSTTRLASSRNDQWA